MKLYLLTVGIISMSAKSNSKHKSLWDGGLFPRPFDGMVEAPFEDCENRLLSLAQFKTGYWNPVSREVQTQKTGDNAFNFEICLRGYGNSGGYTKAKYVGIVFRDSWSDKTTVRGRFTLGLLTPILLTVLLIISPVMLFSHSHYAIYGVVFPIIVLFYGLQIRKEYLRFQSQVYETFHK